MPTAPARERRAAVVVVNKLLPAPPDTGGRRRSYALLRELARHADVTVCCLRAPGDRPGELEQLGVRVRSTPWQPASWRAAVGVAATGSLTAGRVFDPQLRRLVRAATRTPPDLLVAEFSQMAPYLRGVDAGTTLLSTHNVEHALTASYAHARGPARGALYRAEAAALRRLERRAFARADWVSVVSEADRARLAELGRTERVIVAPNGWDPAPPLPPTDEPVVAFVALLGWRPNVDAARWLAGEIWPRVREAVPAARLLLIGRDPAPAVLALGGLPGVEVVGPVPDVRPWLAKAAIATAPLRAGGGSRLKILEALDAGRPVVATPVGAEGLEDLVGHGVVLAASAEQFAAAVVSLLGDPDRRRSLGVDGNAAVAAKYAWPAVLAPLVALLPDQQAP